jgi:hypothetical protein
MDTTFVVADTSFTFPAGTIPHGSLLHSLMYTPMHVERDERKNIILKDVDASHMAIVHDCLVNKHIPNIEMLPIFDYFNIPLTSTYGLSQVRENHLREHMYDPEYVEDEINTDKHYGLTRITEAVWKTIKASRASDKDLLFTEKEYTLLPWSEVVESLKELGFLFDLMPGKIMVAGGRILAALCGTKSSDVDIFFHQTNADEAEGFLKNLLYHLVPPPDDQEGVTRIPYQEGETRPLFPELLRTKNAVTITERVAISREYIMKAIPVKEYQCILRLYRSASEILHGFDVDCCSVGYDGKDLWITDRALYALVNKSNTVNFDRMSPSYLDRLVKYGTRGFAIAIPNFSKASVNYKEIENKYLEYKVSSIKYSEMFLVRSLEDRARRNTLLNAYAMPGIRGIGIHGVHNIDIPLSVEYTEALKFLEANKQPSWNKYINSFDGIDRLLFLEHHCIERKWKKNVVTRIEEMTEEKSDYSPNPYKKFGSTKQLMICQTISHLLNTMHGYPEHAAKYRRLLRVFSNFYEYTIDSAEFNEDILDKDELHTLGFTINMLRSNGTFDFVKCSKCVFSPHSRKDRRYAEDVLTALLHLPGEIYNGLGVVMPWTIPQHIQFKTVNPGEQTTGTFNKLVLDDHSVWYKGNFYSFNKY